MVEVIDVEQGSPAWHAARLGIPTASEFQAMMGKDFVGKSEVALRRKYMLRLIGERLTGEPAEFYSNKHMERGKVMEPEARRLYEFLTDEEPEIVGFLRNTTRGGNVVGCSPDSLLANNGMLEIKSKLPYLHLGVILDNDIPSEHYAQCQGALWVGERDWIDFVSYWPNLPLFIHRVGRDDSFIRHLSAEADRFWEDLLRVERTILAGGITAPVRTSTPIKSPIDIGGF